MILKYSMSVLKVPVSCCDIMISPDWILDWTGIRSYVYGVLPELFLGRRRAVPHLLLIGFRPCYQFRCYPQQ